MPCKVGKIEFDPLDRVSHGPVQPLLLLLNTSVVLLDAKDPSFLHMSKCCTFEPQLLFCGRPPYRATRQVQFC